MATEDSKEVKVVDVAHVNPASIIPVDVTHAHPASIIPLESPAPIGLPPTIERTASMAVDEPHEDYHPLLKSENFKRIVRDKMLRPHISNIVHAMSWWTRQRAYYKDRLVPSGPRASNQATMFNIINCVIGAGILSLPLAMQLVGIIPAVLLLIVMGSIMSESAYLLAKTAEFEHVTSYHQLAGRAFGPLGKNIVSIAVIISCFGACIAYMILGGDFTVQMLIVLSCSPETAENYRQLAIGLISVLIMLPLSSMRSLNSLRITSFMSILFVGFFAVVMLEQLGIQINDHGVAPDVKLAIGGFDFFRFFPVSVFAFSFHTSALPIYIEMKERSPRNWRVRVAGAMAVCGLFYLISSICGYLMFGTNVKGNVLNSFSSNQLMFFVYLAFTFNIIFTYPVALFTARVSLHGLILGETLITRYTHYAWTILIFVITLIPALLLKDVSVVFGFVGSVAGSTTCLILPAVMFLKLARPLNYSKRIPVWRQKAFCILLIVLGVFVMAMGVVSNVVSLTQ